jgi:hypothetical protein
MQQEEAIRTFIRKCRKSFITISGGGDPLFRLGENLGALSKVGSIIREEGYKVRLITREVQHLHEVTNLVDHVSISLDADVLAMIDQHSHHWEGIDVEYSLVLPPLPSHELKGLMPQYAALHRRLGRRLVLRENFNSTWSIDSSSLSIGHSGVVFVPKSLCLDGRYLAATECAGREIIQDNGEVIRWLMDHPSAVLFGGVVKHLLEQAVHLEYADIDLIALDADLMRMLSEKFGYTFQKQSSDGAYPAYFQGRSPKAGKEIQVVLLSSLADAERFVFNAQYVVDRAAHHQGFIFDPEVGEGRVRAALKSKLAEVVGGGRDIALFHHDRVQVEQRHRMKLIKKGFTIT